MQEWSLFVERVGIPLAILAAVAIAVLRLTRYLGVRFFNDETGYVSRFLTNHLSMVEDVRKGVLEVTEAAQQTTATLATVQASIGVTSSASARTNEVLRHLAHAIRALAAKEGVDISHQIEEIDLLLSDRRALGRKP